MKLAASLIIMLITLATSPAAAGGRFSVTLSVPALDNYGPCDSLATDSTQTLPSSDPVAIEVLWSGPSGYAQWGHGSIVRLGCARGVPQRFTFDTWAPGAFLCWVRSQDGATSCWSKPIVAVAMGNR